MNQELISFLRIILMQIVLTAIVAIPFSNASASEVEILTVSEHINSYLYEGESIDIGAELDLVSMKQVGENIVNLRIKALGIEDDAKLDLIVNGKSASVNLLSDELETLKFKLNKNQELKSILIESKGAFIRMIKADISINHQQHN